MEGSTKSKSRCIVLAIAALCCIFAAGIAMQHTYREITDREMPSTDMAEEALYTVGHAEEPSQEDMETVVTTEWSREKALPVAAEKSNTEMPQQLQEDLGEAAAPMEEKWYQTARLIYHACGGIDGNAYTNSREALEHTLQQGNYLVEVDFLFTADDQLICAHTWDDLNVLEPPVTLEEIQQLTVAQNYTLMTGADLIGMMEKEPRLMIVIDTKEEHPLRVIEELVRLAGENEELLHRFIIQLYDKGMKAQVQEIHAFPNENYLFTTYKFGVRRRKEILQICNEENIEVVTVRRKKWTRKDLQPFLNCGIVVFEHTINDVEEARAAMARGVQGVYTDFLQPSDLLQ